jgi:ubiquitin-protein ligase
MEEDIAYQEALYPLMIATYPYSKSITKKIKCAKKLFQDIQQLKKNLPVHFSNSIFVRIDEYNPYFMKVAISGCNETPYDSGLLFFDVEIPDNYPESPPKITAKNLRNIINPSIYGDGKLVWSLLNSWGNDPSEKWNPKDSNLYQVFISIQSLLLNNKPYFNQMNKNCEMNTRTGKENSDKYNNKCYIHTLNDLIIQPLCNPPEGFEDIVKHHFRNKRLYIEDMLYNLWALQIQETEPEMYEKIKMIKPRLKLALDGRRDVDEPVPKDNSKTNTNWESSTSPKKKHKKYSTVSCEEYDAMYSDDLFNASCY